MTDLFAALPRPQPRAPDPAALRSTGTFTDDPVGGAAHFVHHCAACGAVDAPFGTGVRLRAAIAEGNAALAGVWLCFDCWRATC